MNEFYKKLIQKTESHRAEEVKSTNWLLVKDEDKTTGTKTEEAERKPRDPNLDNAAVKKHREIIHLQANYIQREEIAYTVEDSPRGLRIWEATLLEYMLAGYPPKRVDWMLKNYKAMMDNVRAGLSGNGHR